MPPVPPKFWLPPLNFHPDHSVSVVAAQLKESYYDPSISEPIFLVELSVSVTYYPDKSSTDLIFKGLSLDQYLKIDSRELDSEESSREAILHLFDLAYIPFGLNQVYLTERRLDGLIKLPCPLNHRDCLVYQIGKFANCMRQETYNAGHNVLPLKLSVTKRVTVPDWEIRLWNCWLDKKCMDDPDFEEEYTKAISRPRTSAEAEYEIINFEFNSKHSNTGGGIIKASS